MREVADKIVKNRIHYECIKCQYITGNKTDYEKHLMTAKHKKLLKSQKNAEKVAKYSCKKCDYFTCNKTNYEKHLTTEKHKNNFPEKEEMQETQEEDTKEHEENTIVVKKVVVEKLCEKVEDLLEQNKETNQKLLELTEKYNNLTVINNNITNNKNTFNLNIYLNETCKNAIPFPDFMKNLQLTEEEFYKVGEIGFQKTLHSLILKNMKKMSHIERPIHCSDAKRKVIHIKLEDGWTKDKNVYKEPVKKASSNFYIKQLGKSIKSYEPNYKKDSETIVEKKELAIIKFTEGSGEIIYDTIENLATELTLPK
jgi:hypothetical protein